MEIRIGVFNTQRELSYETDQTPDEVEKTIADALEAQAKFLRLTDERGRVFLVPTEALAYVEVGTAEPHRVGFVG